MTKAEKVEISFDWTIREADECYEIISAAMIASFFKIALFVVIVASAYNLVAYRQFFSVDCVR